MKFVENPIPTNELTICKDYVGHICRNINKVYNIPQNEEDMDKSNTWFGNMPIRINLVDEDGKVLRPINKSEMEHLLLTQDLSMVTIHD